MNKVFKYVYRDRTIEKLNSKIKLLGVNSKYDAITFMNIRIITI